MSEATQAREGGRLRLFVAIELPAALRRVIEEVTARLRGAEGVAAKWVAAQNVHLTLRFLDAVEPSLVPRLEDALLGVGLRHRPFELVPGEVGGFPSLTRPRVLWLSLGGDLEVLASLQRDVEAAVVRLGFAREERPFSPHLTLARLRQGVSPEEARRLGQAAAGLGPLSGPSFWVQEIALMRSVLLPTGPRYSRLAAATLARQT